MSQRKRGTRKRKNEDASAGEKEEGEDTEERGHSTKIRATKKYIGAHVGIQGRA